MPNNNPRCEKEMENKMQTPQLIQEQLNKAEIEKQLKRTHLTKLAEVFARANSVLTGRKIKVNVVEQKEYKSPAWSSSSEMWLNANEIKFELNAQSILSLQGLSFHELGHLRYTPRNGHALPIWIKEQDNAQQLWEAFNCLEDCRIETLLTGYLPTISSWLTATIVDYLLGNDEAITTAFPLVYGRKYLPTELRQLATDKYKNPNDVKELASIIDEYRVLIFSSNDDTERAKELIVAFNNLLDNLPKQPNDGGCAGGGGESKTITIRIHNPNGHADRPVEGIESSSVRPAKSAQQKRDLENAIKNQKGDVVLDVVIEKKSDDTSKDNATSNSPSNQKSDNNSPNNQKINDETSFGDSAEFEDFDDVDVDVLDDSDSANGNSAGNAGGVTGSNQQVTDVLNDVLDDVLKELSKDVTRIAKQVGLNVELDGGNATTPSKARYTNVSANAELVMTSKLFGKELERLRSDFDPSWDTQVETGRLDVMRYLQGEDFETCFDEWHEGRSDVTSIEAVILLDRSSSMSGTNADNAYQSMWAIKKALESVEATTSVVLFDSYTTLLYDKNEKAGNTIRDAGANGGTNPKEAILYAKRVLAESNKPIKLLCMITDGAWSSDSGERAITEMKNAGVLTCQALLYEGRVLNTEYLNANRHAFELVTQLQSAKDITTLGKELVRLAISRNLVNN